MPNLPTLQIAEPGQADIAGRSRLTSRAQLLGPSPVQRSLMKRILPAIVATVALLACSSASGAVQGGYDVPTKRLEGVFKIALFERAGSEDGCYPSPTD